MKYKDMTEVETLRQLEWSDHHEFSYDYAMWSFKKLKDYKEVIDKIKYNIEINVISMKNGKLLIELDVNEINELLEEIE